VLCVGLGDVILLLAAHESAEFVDITDKIIINLFNRFLDEILEVSTDCLGCVLSVKGLQEEFVDIFPLFVVDLESLQAVQPGLRLYF
jgi:hypothetical protein